MRRSEGVNDVQLIHAVLCRILNSPFSSAFPGHEVKSAGSTPNKLLICFLTVVAFQIDVVVL